MNRSLKNNVCGNIYMRHVNDTVLIQVTIDTHIFELISKNVTRKKYLSSAYN
jgi:hypothetical protein